MPALRTFHRRPYNTNNGRPWWDALSTFAGKLYASARHIATTSISQVSKVFKDTACRIICVAEKVVGPESDNKPHQYTVVGVLFGFLLYVICAMVAINIPRKIYFYLFLLFGGIIFIAMCAIVAADIRQSKPYHKPSGSLLILFLRKVKPL